MVTRIKICGITRQADADAVVIAGGDALGLNFAASSVRCVNPARASAISAGVRGAVTRVGLFVDPHPDEVSRVLDEVELDVLQFHGSEPASLCRRFGLPFVKVVRVRAPVDLAALDEAYADACCLLLDTWVDGVAGGTGRRFDWTLWPQRGRLPLVLAGGLAPENVAEAVARLSPWGVDVSGGVEGSTPGEKDPDKIRRFVESVRSAEEAQRAGS